MNGMQQQQQKLYDCILDHIQYTIVLWVNLAKACNYPEDGGRPGSFVCGGYNETNVDIKSICKISLTKVNQ